MADKIISLTEYERLRLENDVVILATLQYLLMLSREAAGHRYEGADYHNRLAERAKETEEALSATRLERVLRGESR